MPGLDGGGIYKGQRVRRVTFLSWIWRHFFDKRSVWLSKVEVDDEDDGDDEDMEEDEDDCDDDDGADYKGVSEHILLAYYEALE